MQKLGDTVTLVLKLDRDLKTRLQAAVERGEVSMIIRDLIENYLKNHEPRKLRRKAASC